MESEMVRCHHQRNGHESECTVGHGEGEGRRTCCDPRGCEELDVMGG